MIRGSLTELRWRCSRVGIRIQGCSGMVQASALEQVSVSGYSRATAGDGITGISTGMITAGLNTITTPTFRTAQPSSIGIISLAAKRTSITAEILTVHFPSIKWPTQMCLTARPQFTQARSVDSRMVGSREATRSVDSRVLADFTAAAVSTEEEDSMGVVAAMAAAIGERLN